MKSKNIIISLLILLMVSSTAIILEISLSRLFSYMLSYHFVFIIIAFTLFGLGIGEILFYSSARIKRRIKLFYSFLPYGILVSYNLLIVVNRIAFFSSPAISLFINIILSILPFVNIGLVKADIFQKHKTTVTWFYGVDLLACAAGALVTVGILNSMGLPKAFFVSYILFGLAGLLFWVLWVNNEKRQFLQGMVWIILVVGIGWLIFSKYTIDPAISKDNSKDMLRLMSNPAVKCSVIETEWNSFGRTDLVELITPDGNSEKVMFVDGAAGTDLISIDELESNPAERSLKFRQFPAIFELSFLNDDEKDSVLIIGPGGGIDIAAAWFMNFRQIDAVEINPSFVKLMKKYNPSTFSEKKNITVFVREGRNFVRKTKNKYDVIMLTIPVTKGGRGTDFYGLTENYLFTLDAVEDYLNALTPEGRLVFTLHSPLEVYRMLSNYLRLKELKGIDSKTAMRNVLIYSNRMMPVLVIKKSPFKKNETEIQHFVAHQHNFDRSTFFFPFIPQAETDTVVENKNIRWYMFDRLIYGISQNEFNYKQMSEAALLNLSPVTDDSPYFFNYENGIPRSLMSLFVLSLMIMGWIIFKTVKGWKFRKDTEPLTQKKFKFLAFIILLLGICYFFIQSYLFQVMNLQLSNPAQSFSLLLFTFLLGNGLGSFYSGLFGKNFILKAGWYSFMVTVVMIGISVFVIPGFAGNGVSKSVMMVLLLVPAFFIGIPFPLILKEVSFEQEYILPLFLGISSLVSMATAVIVIVITMLWGYSYVLWLGVSGYFLIAVLLIRNYRSDFKNEYQPINYKHE
ncbi:MAG: hypothetical protein GXO83_01360 [Chlorobi bacterium]|nr:hypothetical protein [Chlorobiota bacterium]